MEQEMDFFLTYKAVSSKLKKRFLKKPNIAEAREEFGQLAKTLNSKGSHHYAGFCCLAMARCEQNMSNTTGEVQALIDSARSFLQADASHEIIHCPNYAEHLNCAKHCYNFAIKTYIANDMPTLAASLCAEIGSYLETNKNFNEALSFHQRSAELYFQNPLLSILAQKKVMELKLLLDDHHGALSTCTEILWHISEKGSYHDDGHTLLGQFAELHCECEVLVILLIMFLNPHPLKIKLTYSEVLQKYTWIDSSSTKLVPNSKGMNDELFVMLQSFLMAYSGKDIQSMQYLQDELRTYLNPQQTSLLESVINELQHPDGLGF